MKYQKVTHNHTSEAFFDIEEVELSRIPSQTNEESYFRTLAEAKEHCRNRKANGIKSRIRRIKELSDGLYDMRSAKPFIIKP